MVAAVSPPDAPVALYDIGSNSVKALVVLPAGHEFDVVLEEVEYSRLGEGVEDAGALCPEAMERTVAALSRLKDKALAAGARRHRAVATSAVRSSSNSEEFSRLVFSRTGLVLEVLSGDDEALCVFRGVCTDITFREQALWVMDLGGGSVEWILGRTDAVEWRQSLPLGCVRMKERFLHRFPVLPEELLALTRHVEAHTTELLREYSPAGRTPVCTGGTMCALARWLDPNFLKISRSGLGFRMSLAQLEQATATLAGMSCAQIAALPGPIAQRADIIVAGAITFQAVFRPLNLREWYVTHRNLRYGLMESLRACPS